MENLKEYLRKNSNGTYSYIGTVRPEHVSDFMIEIPEGAQVYAVNNGYHYFFSSAGIGFEWSILWQRHTHPEELPFIDDEPLKVIDSEYSKDGNSVTHTVSLNDQYAEIEKVRQSHREASETADPTIKETLSQRQEQYGSFEDVAMLTEQMVDVMRKGYYEKLAYNQKMALYMICSKMARIVNGNPNHKDSWHDIAGYATLIDNELVSEKDMPF